MNKFKFTLQYNGLKLEITDEDDLMCVAEQLLGEQLDLEARLDEILDSFSTGLNPDNYERINRALKELLSEHGIAAGDLDLNLMAAPNDLVKAHAASVDEDIDPKDIAQQEAGLNYKIGKIVTG